jgi:uncharacterized cupin superfamily protein
MTTHANLFERDWDFEYGGVGMTAVGRRAGAELLGATVYELEPGSRWADLHAHHANEELILVLDGTPILRTLEGERELATGEVVACRRGRPGAHCLENRSDKTARVLLVSTMNMPDVVEYLERDDVFVLTEAPYTDRAEPEQGRLLRVFHRADGKPVPPDE